MSSPLRILYLENDVADAELVQDTLEVEGIACNLTRVEREIDFRGALEDCGFDLILADYTLPSFDGLSALRIVRQQRPDLPFIFVSGTLGEEVAIEALKIGATDYVVKSRLARLVPAVQRAMRESSERVERKRAEEDARHSENELRNLIAEMPGMAFAARPDGSNEFASRRWKEYTGSSEIRTTDAGWEATVHPDDVDRHLSKWRASLESGEPFENEVRHRSVAGEYRWFLARAVPLRDDSGRIVKWYGTLTDIEDLKRTQEAREQIEEQWRAAFESNPTMYFVVDAGGSIVLVNPFGAQQLGYTVDELLGRPVLDIFYEPDRAAIQRHAEECFAHTGRTMRWEARKVRKDGTIICVRETAIAVFLKKRPVLLVVCEDITEQKRAEEALRRSEAYLAEAERLSHTGSWAWNPLTEQFLYWSEEMFRIFELDPQQGLPTSDTFFQRIHPEDRESVQGVARKAAVLEQPDYVHGHRIVLPDGTVKDIEVVGHPVFDSTGKLLEYVGTAVDVTEQHRNRKALEKAFEEIRILKDQLHRENLALRDEVVRLSMFEEIVGSSPALEPVLTGVEKVGPTDSTVLITGQTGTGKELIARAIHKRSRRSGRAFVSVNCAALASSLISSELFGHEKGAFTGATQRRLGRFELADGGTIFLDEVGELPAETQVALLRVLQERQFERVGGTQSVRVDVRVIAATNRDLKAAIANGTFRQDLFYRLNVFPIEVPPLRERKEDILMLVEYFVQRYARAAGKDIRSIDKNTLELFQSYDWPGNIRELQNVVERSVILTSGDVLRVDESWLSREIAPPSRRAQAPVSLDEEDREERELIETALTESRGRVSGSKGAAAKLGIPPSTLEYKIKTLKIRKSRFRFG